MAEGKTLSPAPPCKLCDEGDAVKFCTHCGEDLCARCARAHGRVQATSHHTLIPIGNKVSSGIRPKTKQVFCSEHTSKPLGVICEDCLCAVCDACAAKDHRDHKLLRSNLNATVLQRISAQKVPEFMDILHKLQKEKDGSPVKLELYKTARNMVKSWRDHLCKIVEQDSENLLKEIEKEINKQETLLADIDSGLKEAVKTTDKHMSLLSNARKIDDSAFLMANIHEGDNIIGKAKTLLREIESTRKTYTIDDLLPFRNELTNVEKSVHTFFTMTKLEDDAESLPTNPTVRINDYSVMTKRDKCHIGKHEDNLPLRISETGQRNSKQVVVYHVNTPDIYVYDMESKQQKQFTCTKKIWRMTSLTDDTHVMVTCNTYNIHLLDANFCVLATINIDNWGAFMPGIHSVCRVSADTFILSENHSDITTMRLTEMTVSHNNTFSRRQLCTVDVKDSIGCLALLGDRKYITLRVSFNTIHTVNLTTGELTELDLGSHIDGSISYICVYKDDRILVGDSEGKIHQITSTKYERELKNMKGEGWIGGISVSGDKVAIVDEECIKVYQ